jgi:hypothetical protein
MVYRQRDGRLNGKSKAKLYKKLGANLKVICKDKGHQKFFPKPFLED